MNSRVGLSDGAVASIQLNLPIRLHDRSPSPDRLLAELLGQDYASLCDLPAGRSVEVLAKRLGVEVKRLPMETLGQLLADSTRPVVLLREDADPRRQRYTLAHELAHLLVCRASERRFVSPALREVTRCESMSTLEWHVDRIASAILLPESRFRREIASLGQAGIRGLDAAFELKKRFSASLVAVCRRLAFVTSDYLTLACTLRPAPGKATCCRVDWSVCRNPRVSFVPRNKSLSDEGPAARAIQTRRPVHALVTVDVADHELQVARAYAVPYSAKGALLLLDLACDTPLGSTLDIAPRLLAIRSRRRGSERSNSSAVRSPATFARYSGESRE